MRDAFSGLAAAAFVIVVAGFVTFYMAKAGAPQQKWIWCEVLKYC